VTDETVVFGSFGTLFSLCSAPANSPMKIDVSSRRKRQTPSKILESVVRGWSAISASFVKKVGSSSASSPSSLCRSNEAVSALPVRFGSERSATEDLPTSVDGLGVDI
jgi:hypothetical protein